MLRPANGQVKNSGGKFVFVGKVYGTPSINEDPPKVQALLRRFPRLNAAELTSPAAADGVYTWLLYSVVGSDEVRFVATEVISPFEIGTRHQSMVYNARIEADKIYGGGELIKEDGAITFNLLSGTYSRPLVEANYDHSVSNAIVAAFKGFFPEAEYDRSRDSYISKVKTVPRELLDVYKEAGYTVRVFDVYNDYVSFSNTFWNTDFRIEYYKKKVAETPAGKEREMIQALYTDTLQRMLDLLKPPAAASPSVASPSVASPSVASPSVASPSVAETKSSKGGRQRQRQRLRHRKTRRRPSSRR
jgi:hypothetical protein